MIKSIITPILVIVCSLTLALSQEGRDVVVDRESQSGTEASSFGGGEEDDDGEIGSGTRMTTTELFMTTSINGPQGWTSGSGGDSDDDDSLTTNGGDSNDDRERRKRKRKRRRKNRNRNRGKDRDRDWERNREEGQWVSMEGSGWRAECRCWCPDSKSTRARG